MRKQYHFRKVENDTYIWDVDRLVEITQSFQVRQVPLSDIKELDEAYWYPDAHPTTQDIIAHMQLILEADLSYPIILCVQGRLMDGMHRVGKAKIQHHDRRTHHAINCSFILNQHHCHNQEHHHN